MSRKAQVVGKTGKETAELQPDSEPGSKSKNRKSSVSSKSQSSKKSSEPLGRSRIDALAAVEPETLDQEETGVVRVLPDSDFQGISEAEEADSESIEELVEEGNIFEAGAVAGVERAENLDGREVYTRQLNEDDVPDEYLNMD